MEIKLPKKCTANLMKKVNKAIQKIDNGVARLRKTEAYGYKTCELGGGDRLVMVNNSAFAFSKHSDYEKFISQRH
ncbi:hypothetical protein [Psychromonas aquimarina]|uniref:hypothetical protein n=1 Tax=Psychromonas aquimarina TaxID=444919 RepID=UPI0004911C0D|nr:hypothetical protein [Psychromonas aquimarina]